MVQGPKISFTKTKARYIGVRYTKRIDKDFAKQNPWDQAFGSLYREVCYIRDSLYLYSTVYTVLEKKSCEDKLIKNS